MSRPLRPQLRARVIPTLLEVALVLSALPASAQEPSAPAPPSSCVAPAPTAPARRASPDAKAPDERRASASPADKVAAAEMVRQASSAREPERKAEGVELLRRAYALYPAPGLALMLAEWESELGHIGRAEAVVADLLRDPSLVPPQREEAERRIAALRARLGSVSLQAPSDMAFHLDDGRDVFGGDTFRVDPGSHALVGSDGRETKFVSTLGASVSVTVSSAVPVGYVEPPLGGVPPPPPPMAGCACHKEPSYARGGHFPEGLAVAAVGLVLARRRRR
jgi:hypothetical protein